MHNLIFKLIILLSATGLFSCNRQAEEGTPEGNPSDKWSFAEFVDHLPKSELPIMMHHSEEDPNAYRIPDSLRKKLDASTDFEFGVIGLLAKKPGFIALLLAVPGDDIVPYLRTYTPDGKPIDSLLTNIGFPDGPWGTSHPWASIDEHLFITLGDSGISYDLDTNMRPKGSETFRKIKHFQVNEEGKILPVDKARTP